MNKEFLRQNRRQIVLIAILIFLMTALITSVVMFVKAEHLAQDAERTERIVRETDSLCEVLKASGGSTQGAAQLLAEHRSAEASKSALTLYYTGGFNPAGKGEYRYRVSIQLDAGKDGGYDTWEIDWFTAAGQKAFYSRSFKSVVN